MVVVGACLYRQRHQARETMASRSKRSSTRTVRESSAFSINDDTGDSGSFSNSNPRLSSRIQEKEHLSSLNDRLAAYIDKVRALETENARLHVQIRDVEVIERREKDNLSQQYEDKIAGLRAAVEALSREKSKIELDSANATAKYHDLRGRVDKLEKDLKRVETERNAYQARNGDLQARYDDADARRADAENKFNELVKEIEILRHKVDSVSSQLEDEVLLRGDLQNKLNSAREDLEFARRQHSTQLEEQRRQRQVEMTTVSTQIESRYQAKLAENIQRMRDDFDARLAAKRAETDKVYQEKVSEALEAANRARKDAAAIREEFQVYRARSFGFEKERDELEKKLEASRARTADLEAQLRRIQDEVSERVRSRDQRITELENEVGNLLVQYQDLMDLKIKLDTELQTYQSLLEGEETRLHITPNSTINTSAAGASASGAGASVSFSNVLGSPRGVKRRRVDREEIINYDHSSKRWLTESNADTDVVVDDVDTNGRFVKLTNKGTDDQNIGGWSLRLISSGRETVFKFHARQSIKAGKSTTIFSSDSGETHVAPHTLVMKNQSWPTGDHMRAELLNEEATIVAWRDLHYTTGFSHNLESDDPNQRCSIM
uniref:Lamin n=1 Tax=Panagrellus redivivus TaxID=6233 RepID=A0A7E4ZXI4_PANRE